MRQGDTIVAPASAPGRSGRAVVRASGAGAFAAIERLGWRGAWGCEGAAGSGTPRGRGVAPGVLRLGAVELPVMVSAFPGPGSYTGEDIVEVQLPGNPHLVQRLLLAMTALEGVRLATPGEFTARAYLAGRLTLPQAEGVAALIAATTREQLEASADLMAGRTGDAYRAWSEELATLLALVEAGIDFTDQEDVVAIGADALHARLSVLAEALRAHLGGAGEAGDAVARVALVGRPNAGKSTLFNALLGRARSVTSPVAGTTRDVLEEELDLSREAPGAGTVMLQDLAGLEPGAGGPDQDAARRALGHADLLLWCDPTGRFDAGPLPLAGKPALRVRTFGDRARGAGAAEDVAVCALDGWNLGVLRRAIADRATTARAASVAALLPRHRRAVGEALARVCEAAALAADTDRVQEPEVVALSLRLALDQIGELTGQISPDDVLGRVFATFCVGK